MPKVTAALVQMDIVWEDREANFRQVEQYAKEASAQGADLLILPEMFSTGFSMNPSVTAEPPNGPTISFLKELAQTHCLNVIGGVVLESEGNKGRNCAVAVDRQGCVVSEYAKSHLFSFLGEDHVHTAGDGPKIFTLEGISFACFVCYDLRFPELFRLIASKVAAMVVIASWPSSRQSHWDVLLPARAVENQCYAIGVNRVGSGGDLDFEGGTVCVDPMGTVLFREKDSAGVFLSEIDTGVVSHVRETMPFLKDVKFL